MSAPRRPPPARVRTQRTTRASATRLTIHPNYELHAIDPQAERESCKRRMIASGWCHHRVNYLANRYKPETFAYLSTLKYLRDEKHDLCRTSPSCIAYSVDNSRYQTRHVRSGCTCRFVETPHEELQRVAETGGVPLVEIEYDFGYKLKIRRRVRSSQYVAISHVWADGLGNPSQSALPSCQIERLHKLVEKVVLLPESGQTWRHRPVLFWLDTLCIPPTNPVIRMSQIDMMASIYKGARSCLIMDEELMSLHPKCYLGTIDLGLEARARFLCCAWNSRSWTLQEGALATHRTVLFADNALAALQDNSGLEFRLVSRAQDQGTTRNDNLVQDHRNDRVRRIRNDLDLSYPDPFRMDFAQVWNQLTGRATSQPADIPLIVANLLKMDVGNLLSYDLPEERYQAILLGLRLVPLSIFSNHGPRYAGTGTKETSRAWLPTAVSHEPLRPKPVAHVRSDGLWMGHKTVCYTLQTPVRPRFSLPKYLQFSDHDSAYLVEPADLYLDESDIASNLGTCIVLDPLEHDGSAHLAPAHIRRGSCFSVVYTRHGVTAISFRGPLRFATWNHDVYDSMLAERWGSDMKFQILFEPLPGIKPLRKRRFAAVSDNHWIFNVYITMIFVPIPVCYLAVTVYLGGNGKASNPIKFVIAVLLIGIAVLGPLFGGAQPLWDWLIRLSIWWETRAYERIRRKYELANTTSGEGV